MALLHQTTVTPSKLELLALWAPGRSWFQGDAAGEFRLVGSFRFDDPAGEVGIQILLVRAGDGPVLQFPLTYRGAPLEGAEQWLVGTMEHGVLGRRWTYDGLGDPVYLETVAIAALTGGREADEYFEVDGKQVARESTGRAFGSGTDDATVPVIAGVPTVHDDGSTSVAEFAGIEFAGVEVAGLTVRVARVPIAHPLQDADPASERLTGTWAGQFDPVTLAVVKSV